jgi:hypothetical protein
MLKEAHNLGLYPSLRALVKSYISRFIITLASFFTIGKVYGWQTFPKFCPEPATTLCPRPLILRMSPS